MPRERLTDAPNTQIQRPLTDERPCNKGKPKPIRFPQEGKEVYLPVQEAELELTKEERIALKTGVETPDQTRDPLGTVSREDTESSDTTRP